MSGQTPGDNAGRLPLLSTGDHHYRGVSDQSNSQEIPPGPPNTLARPSLAQTPSTRTLEDEDDETEPPIEIRVKRVLADTPNPHTLDRSRAKAPNAQFLAPPRSNSLPASPTIPRQLSNLALEELQFQSHRDSVEIVRGHIKREHLDRYHPERPNSLLLAARDSYSLAKRRLDSGSPTAPTPEQNSNLKLDVPSIHWTRYGGLSPIADGSPPRDDRWSTEKQHAISDASPRLSPRSRAGSPAGGSQAREYPWREGASNKHSEDRALLDRIENLETRVEKLESRLPP